MRKKFLIWKPAIFFAIVMILPRILFAHVETGKAAGFISGIHHPISGWDHIAAMIAVGLWGAQLGAPAIWMLPVAFPMMMAIGGFLGLIGVPLPGVEIGIGISAVVLGTMVALELKPPLFVCVLIVAIFAIFHGYAHGAELAPGTSALAFSLGFVVSTGCLHGIGILIGLVHKWQTGRSAVRLAGGLIAAAGALFVWKAIS
ncbi:MAG TPA: HupE/UreJ family protein [Acidobacteriota bacterium]|nr:HupE/UreJ family protein [Acidobacteriota bacterium]